MQLKKISQVLSKGQGEKKSKVALMDLSKNDIGDRGVQMIARWIGGRADGDSRSSNDDSSSSSAHSFEVASKFSVAEQVVRPCHLNESNYRQREPEMQEKEEQTSIFKNISKSGPLVPSPSQRQSA